MALGTLPTTSGGPLAYLSGRWPVFSATLEGRFDLPTSLEVDGGARVDAWLIVGTLSPCAHWRAVFGCAFLSLGSMHGAGHGVDAPRAEQRFYAALGPRIGLEVPLGDVMALRVHGDLMAPIRAVTLQLRGRDVWASPDVAAVLGLSFSASITSTGAASAKRRSVGSRNSAR